MEARTSSPSLFALASTLIALSLFNPHGQSFTQAARIHVDDKTPTSNSVATSCNTATYPNLCLDSLSAYANTIKSDPAQLAQTAISVSLASARNASATVSALAAAGRMKPREAAAVKDCIVSVGYSVAELQRSLKAMGSLRSSSKGVKDEVESIRAWVSAALTDENTCMEGFVDGGEEGEVKENIRGEIVKVAQLTSNALSVVGGLASAISP